MLIMSLFLCFPRVYISQEEFEDTNGAVPDLPLCLRVLKHRSSLTRRASPSCQKKSTMDFCLCGAILNLKVFCFGAIPDIMIELIAYWSVPQSRQS